MSIQVRIPCSWSLGVREHLSRGKCCNVSYIGYSGPDSPSEVLIFLQGRYLVSGSGRSTRKHWSPIFSSAVDDGMDSEDSEDDTEKDETSESKAKEENSRSIRENLERIVGKDDSAFSGLDLATLIRNKYGRSYDVQLIKKEFMGKNLLAMNVMWKYVEQVLSSRLGRKPDDIVKLDANENPYGPPPEVFEALGSMKFPYIYPDPESRRLRAALADDSGIESEYILVGCGADELIDLIMRCVLEPGDKIVDCPPTFTMYEFDAAVNGALVIKVPRKSDFSLDVGKIAKVVEQERPKCIFLTSPNNPDGSIIDDKALLRILDLPILVVLDEAYIEFSGIESRMQWVKKHENLIILRTFSKRAALAGLRVGYGAFPLSIIEYLWRAKQPYNVSVAAEVSACAALSNPTYLETVKVALVQERERLFRLLEEVPFLKPYPSYSNFILCEVTSGKDAKKLKEDLSKMGVIIRHYSNKELSGYVRISVGKPEQTDALLKCLNSLS